jgi:stearoyl-CoA 9-desaturase NADPH oxidoreductase
MPATVNSPVRSRRRWYQSSWLRPFNDRNALDELVQRLRPQAALSGVRARIEGIIEETADTRTYLLRANRHWRGHRAGQHVLVEVEVAGRRLQRCFSLSAAPGRRGRVQITVKRQPGQGVSAWMHERLGPGDTLGLGQALGSFGANLPDSGPLLLLSAGSGITPMIAHLQALVAAGTARDVVFVHSCRSRDQLILAEALNAAAAAATGIRVVLHYSAEQGRLDAGTLRQHVPDLASRYTLACGPRDFNAWVESLYGAEGALSRIEFERFAVPLAKPGAAATTQQTVTFKKAEHSFTAATGQSLLSAAEAAGLSPRHGCRIGICRSCQCRKLSGRSENLLTGEICDEPGQLIQLCISSARSPLLLDL